MDAWAFALWVVRLYAPVMIALSVTRLAWADPPPVMAAGDNKPPVEAVGGVSLPPVPREIARAAIEAGAAARREVAVAQGGAAEPNGLSEAREGSTPLETSVSLTVAPGTTELVRVARGFLNRIITPFTDPKLLSVNPIEVRKEGNSLYVATNSTEPVGVHILPNEPTDSRSISLTLIPVRIPPRTIELRWPQGSLGSTYARSDTSAKHWEESAPYEARLFDLVRAVARGDVPEGYALSETRENLPCLLPGVSFLTGQRLTGHYVSVFVLRAQNAGSSPIELQGHAGCDLPGVAAVAPWPQAYLQPGESTELYVAVLNDVFEARSGHATRPSLLMH